jgi:hypothetical protein
MKKPILLLIIASITLSNCTTTEDEALTPEQISVSGNAAITPIISPTHCGKILIDASKDGGVWWYPQAGLFDAQAEHQGKVFADFLKDAGFEVTELGRDKKVTDELLDGYQIIIRASGFERYDQTEVEAYQKAIDRGISLVLLSDHKANDNTDEIADLLKVQFFGVTPDESLNKFANHPLFENVNDLRYLVGAYIETTDENLQPLAWLSDGNPVAGILKHSKSRIFVMGDVNAIEFLPQPFSNNLATWLGEPCSNN